MPHSQSKSVEWVTTDIIRHHFNNSQILEKVRLGELKSIIKRNSYLSTLPVGEPVCTHSQIVYYYTQEDEPIAVVHQYLRPDGTFGGSGLPDPKRLFLEDHIISVRSGEPNK